MKVHPHPEAEEPFNYRNPMLRRRILVFALGLSFVACLLALWVTGTVFGYPSRFLPPILMMFIQQNRLVILIIPLLSLLACYFTLRHVTGDIMACPERYLDERQKMVRDRAYHHAYKIVNCACLLLVLFLSFNAILFPVRQTTIVKPLPTTYATVAQSFVYVWQTVPKDVEMVSFDKEGNVWLVAPTHARLISAGWVNPGIPIIIDKAGNQWFQMAQGDRAPSLLTSLVFLRSGEAVTIKTGVSVFYKFSALRNDGPSDILRSIPEPVLWPNDPASISLFYSVLLLSLFLLVRVLPMSVVAWKERT